MGKVRRSRLVRARFGAVRHGGLGWDSSGVASSGLAVVVVRCVACRVWAVEVCQFRDCRGRAVVAGTAAESQVPVRRSRFEPEGYGVSTRGTAVQVRLGLA
jgi:hypothetical protein